MNTTKTIANQSNFRCPVILSISDARPANNRPKLLLKLIWWKEITKFTFIKNIKWAEQS